METSVYGELYNQEGFPNHKNAAIICKLEKKIGCNLRRCILLHFQKSFVKQVSSFLFTHNLLSGCLVKTTINFHFHDFNVSCKH